MVLTPEDKTRKASEVLGGREPVTDSDFEALLTDDDEATDSDSDDDLADLDADDSPGDGGGDQSSDSSSSSDGDDDGDDGDGDEWVEDEDDDEEHVEGADDDDDGDDDEDEDADEMNEQGVPDEQSGGEAPPLAGATGARSAAGGSRGGTSVSSSVSTESFEPTPPKQPKPPKKRAPKPAVAAAAVETSDPTEEQRRQLLDSLDEGINCYLGGRYGVALTQLELVGKATGSDNSGTIGGQPLLSNGGFVVLAYVTARTLAKEALHCQANQRKAKLLRAAEQLKSMGGVIDKADVFFLPRHLAWAEHFLAWHKFAQALATAKNGLDEVHCAMNKGRQGVHSRYLNELSSKRQLLAESNLTALEVELKSLVTQADARPPVAYKCAADVGKCASERREVYEGEPDFPERLALECSAAPPCHFDFHDRCFTDSFLKDRNIRIGSVLSQACLTPGCNAPLSRWSKWNRDELLKQYPAAKESRGSKVDGDKRQRTKSEMKPDEKKPHARVIEDLSGAVSRARLDETAARLPSAQSQASAMAAAPARPVSPPPTDLPAVPLKRRDSDDAKWAGVAPKKKSVKNKKEKRAQAEAERVADAAEAKDRQAERAVKLAELHAKDVDDLLIFVLGEVRKATPTGLTPRDLGQRGIDHVQLHPDVKDFLVEGNGGNLSYLIDKKFTSLPIAVDQRSGTVCVDDSPAAPLQSATVPAVAAAAQKTDELEDILGHCRALLLKSDVHAFVDTVADMVGEHESVDLTLLIATCRVEVPVPNEVVALADADRFRFLLMCDERFTVGANDVRLVSLPADSVCEECIICLTATRVGCAHCSNCRQPYHVACIREWMREKAICPVCQHQYPLENDFPPLQ